MQWDLVNIVDGLVQHGMHVKIVLSNLLLGLNRLHDGMRHTQGDAWQSVGQMNLVHDGSQHFTSTSGVAVVIEVSVKEVGDLANSVTEERRQILGHLDAEVPHIVARRNISALNKITISGLMRNPPLEENVKMTHQLPYRSSSRGTTY